jgi:hypothetical protein
MTKIIQFFQPRNIFWKRDAETKGKVVAMLSQIVVHLPLLHLSLGLLKNNFCDKSKDNKMV